MYKKVEIKRTDKDGGNFYQPLSILPQEPYNDSKNNIDDERDGK